MKLPSLWIKYLAWINDYIYEFPYTCLPQVIYPNQMMLHAHDDVNRLDLELSISCLPPILMWNPLIQYPLFFNSMNCPNCGNALLFKKWNVLQPRVLQDTDSVVLLIGSVYTCSDTHAILSYDSRLLTSFPTQDVIPFVLAHRTGFMKRLLNLIVAHIEQGQDFTKTLATIECCQSKFRKHTAEYEIPRMSRFTITSIFLQCFFCEKEEQFVDDMRRVESNGWISVDHTFQVASNIGYLRSDHKWITQYNSVFIVMNEMGQVMSWQFTTSQSTNEVRKLLQALHYRSKQQDKMIHSIIIDNCCQWKSFLQDVFGSNVNVKLDVFHAVQRITRTLSKKEKYYCQFLSELRMLFRRSGDVGIKRVLSTPETEVIIQNLEGFIGRWTKIINMRDSTLKELNGIKRHAACLANIPSGIGTNRNEALHKNINPYFKTARLGVQVAYALLFLLFWIHNNRTTSSNESTSSNDTLQKTVCHDHSYIEREQFGILAKTQHEKFWGIYPITSFDEAIETTMIRDGMESSDSSMIITIEDAIIIVQDVLNTVKMIETTNTLFSRSPLLGKHLLSLTAIDNERMVPSTNCADKGYEEHERRLNDLLHVCGLAKVPVPKDGNCCFTAVSLALKNLDANSTPNSDLKHALTTALPLDVNTPTEEINKCLRHLVYKEWTDFQAEYQDYIPGDNFQEEASKFLINGFFMSDLGDTVVKALCNALKTPIVVLSSVPGTPFLHFKPRQFIIHAPLVIAYNQFGAGHYDSVSYVSIAPQSGVVNIAKRNLSCKCGVNDKGPSVSRCCPDNPLYVSRCPCLKEHRKCSFNCLCKGCDNPYGKKPTINKHKLTRKRNAHQMQIIHLNNTEFLKKKNERVTKGEWSLFESVLLRRARLCAKQIKGTDSTEDVHQVYHEVVEFIKERDMNICIGEKSLAAIMYKVNQQKRAEETLDHIT